jgi:hypothetical protein
MCVIVLEQSGRIVGGVDGAKWEELMAKRESMSEVQARDKPRFWEDGSDLFNEFWMRRTRASEPAHTRDTHTRSETSSQ